MPAPGSQQKKLALSRSSADHYGQYDTNYLISSIHVAIACGIYSWLTQVGAFCLNQPAFHLGPLRRLHGHERDNKYTTPIYCSTYGMYLVLRVVSTGHKTVHRELSLPLVGTGKFRRSKHLIAPAVLIGQGTAVA